MEFLGRTRPNSARSSAYFEITTIVTQLKYSAASDDVCAVPA